MVLLVSIWLAKDCDWNDGEVWRGNSTGSSHVVAGRPILSGSFARLPSGD